MINIKEIKPLNSDQIILFASHIDLFLLKDTLSIDEIMYHEIEAPKRLLDIRNKDKTNGVDILSGSTEYIKQRENYFYKMDILEKWKDMVCPNK